MKEKIVIIRIFLKKKNQNSLIRLRETLYPKNLSKLPGISPARKRCHRDTSFMRSTVLQ